MLLTIVQAYLVLVNALALALMHIDKEKARRGAWRISEATLIGTAVLGGSIGAICGMYLFHHKTRHAKFKIGLPLILIVQISIVALLMKLI